MQQLPQIVSDVDSQEFPHGLLGPSRYVDLVYIKAKVEQQLQETRSDHMLWHRAGRLEDLQKMVRDKYRFEHVKQRYAVQNGDGPIQYKCWTCCVGTKDSTSCNRIRHHVCSNPVPKAEIGLSSE